MLKVKRGGWAVVVSFMNDTTHCPCAIPCTFYTLTTSLSSCHTAFCLKLLTERWHLIEYGVLSTSQYGREKNGV